MKPVSVGAVMRSINNFFETGYRDTEYKVENGQLKPNDLHASGMWIAINGSFYHDGVWQIGDDGYLKDYPTSGVDEKFYGRVWFLHPPKAFLETCENIAEFVEKTPAGGLQSESFGEYSQTRASGKNGGVLTWQEAFADDLRPHRNMYTEVDW